jgi:hypothetical protein
MSEATRTRQALRKAPSPGSGHPQELEAPPGGPDRGAIPIDIGPPPPMPQEPAGVWPFGLSRLTAMGIARDRLGLESFSTFRAVPQVGIYRVELLAWIDAMEAYEKAKQQ